MPDVPCADMLSFVVDDATVDVSSIVADCERLESMRGLIFQKMEQFIASSTPLVRIKDETYNTAETLRGFKSLLEYIDLRCGPVESTSNPAVFSTRTCNHTYAWPGRNPLIH